MCYCLSGFWVCGPKLLDVTPIFPNVARYQLRYTRISTTFIILEKVKEGKGNF